MSDADELSEEIAKAALDLPSALTPGYKATLDAVEYLRHDHPHKAANKLRDAAFMENREEFERFAEQAEALTDD